MSALKRSSPDLNRAVEELLPGLYGTAYYLTGDSHRAEDVVQETITMLLETSRKDPSRIRKPRAWCMRVLSRVAWKKRPFAESAMTQDVAADGPSPEQDASDAELRHLVRDSVQTLPYEQRQAVSLHVFGGLTVREVARAMDLPRSTAHERLHQGLASLRKKLVVASSVALIPSVARSAELVGWLRTLPAPPVPPTLASWVTATATATGASLVTQTTGGLVVSALSAKSVVIGTGAVMLIGLVGLGVQLREMRVRNDALQLEAAAARRADAAELEVAALRESNQDLRRRLAALERAQREAAGAESDAATASAATKTPSPEDIDRLYAEATAAVKAHDRQRFAAAFLALIDAGPAAHAALIQLANDHGGSYNHIYYALEGEDADYPFRHRLSNQITQRRATLAGLLDAIFSRPGEVDGATLFAFDLMTYNQVQSGRPRKEHVAAMMDALSTAIETEEENVEWNDHAVQACWALGRLRATEHLPELEHMLLDPTVSRRNKSFIAQAIGDTGGEEAVALLERLRDSANVAMRGNILRNLVGHAGPGIDEFLDESLARETDSGIRSSLVREMSRRQDSLQRVIAKLDRGELKEYERLTVLEKLFESRDEAHRKKAWEYYETLGRDTQDEVIGAFAGKDSRATELLFERLGEETFSHELTRGFLKLDSRIVHRRSDTLREVAGDSSAPVNARGAAAGALAQIDSPGAVEALLTGFDELPERERRNVIGYLADFVRGKEAHAALEEIASNDPAPEVRSAAERAAQR